MQIVDLPLFRYKDGNLPPILYLQVDGGAENTSKALLGMVELMVSTGLFKEIYWTRLPVGHTHEDIDAKFSQISSIVATRQVRSPQQYKALSMIIDIIFKIKYFLFARQ